MEAENVQSICSIRMCQLRNEGTLTKPTHRIEKPYPAIRCLRCGLFSFFRCQWLGRKMTHNFCMQRTG